MKLPHFQTGEKHRKILPRPGTARPRSSLRESYGWFVICVFFPGNQLGKHEDSSEVLRSAFCVLRSAFCVLRFRLHLPCFHHALIVPFSYDRVNPQAKTKYAQRFMVVAGHLAEPNHKNH
jgi:hypothetical protein